MLHKYKKLEEIEKYGEAKELLNMVLFTLQCMARGVIHDYVGGVFHRYSVDECWHVPHFEKMLYDQGQLCRLMLTWMPFLSPKTPSIRVWFEIFLIIYGET